MKYRIERSEGDDCWDDVEKIAFGPGPWWYVYIDDEPALAVETHAFSHDSDVVIFSDYLAVGDSDNGIHFINLLNFEVTDVEISRFFCEFVVDRNTLYVLGAEYIMAYNSKLELLWKSKRLSADGVYFKGLEGDIMTVECCLMPWSEDWFDVTISLLDGSIIHTPIEFHN